MTQKLPLLIAIALLLAVGTFYLVRQKAVATTVSVEEPSQPSQTDDSQQTFVTDVDPDVSHWQTKENRGIVFKFPKEWYWIEIPGEISGYYDPFVISNNKNFPIEKYPDVNFSGFSGTLTNNTEVVLTVRGEATSDVGVPIDKLSLFIKSAQERGAVCAQSSGIRSLPIFVSCIKNESNHGRYYFYYLVSKKTSLALTVRTTEDAPISEEIFKKIVENIKVQ